MKREKNRAAVGERHRVPGHGTSREHGFTILEILVAIALLGILTAVLTTTLTGSLSLNRQAQRQLDTASNVQQVMERVRNSWGGSSSTSYDSACAPGLSIPSGYTVKFINLSSRAEPISLNNVVLTGTTTPTQYSIEVVGATASCNAQTGDSLTTTPASPPTMRRVIVQSGTAGPNNTQVIGPQDMQLTLDILRPQ